MRAWRTIWLKAGARCSAHRSRRAHRLSYVAQLPDDWRLTHPVIKALGKICQAPPSFYIWQGQPGEAKVRGTQALVGVLEQRVKESLERLFGDTLWTATQAQQIRQFKDARHTAFQADLERLFDVNDPKEFNTLA